MLLLLFGNVTWAEVTIADKQARPNILIFLVDDLGARDLGCYGSTFYETPIIDQFAQEGQRFTQAYAAHPRCVPSRYGLFTGRFPARDGCPGDTYGIAPQTRTLAEALQEGGYASLFVGKWHLSKNPEALPQAQGFDINIAGGAAGAPLSYFAPYNQTKNQSHKAKKIEGLNDAPVGEYLTDRLTDETILYLKKHAASGSKKPFFAVLAHYAVHTPFEAKKNQVHYFKSKLSSQKKEAFSQRDGNTKITQDNATYAAMIRSTDDSMGRILKTLDEMKLADNTLVIFTSDHGGLSNRGSSNKRPLATSNLPFRAGKGHLYEGGIRVPFIIRWPGITAPGEINEAIVTGTDLYATCLEAAKLKPEPDHSIDSVSIVPALKGKPLKRDPILWHNPRPRPGSTGDTASSALRLGKYKLIKFYFPEVYYECYDLDADPGEHQNLFHPEKPICAHLSDLLNSSLIELGAIEPNKGK
ncbi:MAG: Arylsulfatase [Opitutia bacterium UBA7350]|nr:MAG: Arylsulfatase [Opitutae bacterium UBA7350]